ncbi:MAG: spore germination protein [Lachnospiraceae bacterium]|nr:spore germination protein [Lachnospiraceae bacterium]MDD3616580.1 spore germination protein [Lachnospiraceae bacterium]
MNVVSRKIEENIGYFDKRMNLDKSFDLIRRTIVIGGRQACFYFIDGFCKDEVMQKMLDSLKTIQPEQMPERVHEFSHKYISYIEVDLLKEPQKIETNILSGVLCLFIDGYDAVIAIDCRTYPARSVDEPDKDKVLRGSRDGFVETIVFNTALIRRRIRDPKLVMEIMQIGTTSKTDVVISYMEDRVNEKLLEKVRTLLKNLNVDAITMNQESLSECIYHNRWYNPFPKFKYTERPDTTAASILEGRIAILTDTSPAAMVFPMSIFGMVEEANDYYFPPITGSYLRFTRTLITILTLIVTPLYVLATQYPQMVPASLQFVLVKDVINLPVVIQLFVLEFAIDGLRLAAINTPSMLTTPLSVIAGLVVGDYAVQSGWFNAETMLYMAFVAIANYTQSSYELGYALKFMRLIILFFTGIFKFWGFVGGILLTLIIILCNRTVSGESYLYPLIPFNLRQLCRRVFRYPIECQVPSEKSNGESSGNLSNKRK